MSGEPSKAQPKRDKTGKFLKGHAGGPGRPSARGERLYMAAFADELDEATWRELVRAAITRAKAGEDHPMDWLVKYAMGPAGKYSLEDALQTAQDGPLTARQALESLLPHPDPAIRLGAARTLLETQTSADQMEKWLAVVAEASCQTDMPTPEGPNPWQPEGET